MALSIQDVDFSKLTLDERALLAHDLIESVRAEADASPVPPEYLGELRRRMAEIEAGGVTMLGWDEIRSSIFGSR